MTQRTITGSRFEELSEERKNEIYSYRSEEEGRVMLELFQDFKMGRPMSWRVVPATSVKLIWNHFAQHGEVSERHLKLLYKIVDQVSENILKLWVCTYLCGHTSLDPDYDFRENGLETEDDQDQFYDWVDWHFISDYGFPCLNELWNELQASQDPIHLLVTVDRIFNVWHGSGPLADRFIEGGTHTLNDLLYSSGPANTDAFDLINF